MSITHSAPPAPMSRLRNHCSLFASLSDHHLVHLEAHGTIRTYALEADERVEFRGRDHDEVVYLLYGSVTVGDGTINSSATEHACGCRPVQLYTDACVSLCASEATLLCRINRSQLDYVVAWNSLGDTTRHGSDDFEEFLERLRNPAVFRHLPLANVEDAFRQMTRLELSDGEVVMSQGDPADNFYIIESGSAEIWQMGLYDDEQKKVAEIGPGDHFGGDALVSGGTRNATVRMTSAGSLLVLTGEQFKALIERPMVHEVDARVAQAMIGAGECKVLDVRYQEEWEERHLPDVILSPLDQLRHAVAELDPAQQYITCCRSGKRSAVAAMILEQNGINAVSLRGGINAWPYETVSAC